MPSDFEIQLVIEQIDSILEGNVNHANYNYLKELKEELESKLQYKGCGYCEKPCGNSYCVTEDDK